MMMVCWYAKVIRGSW